MKRLGIAFVTFRDERMTSVWVNDSLTLPSCSAVDSGILESTGDLHCSCLFVFHSIVKDYSCLGCHRKPQQSSITTVVQSHKWGVNYAPAPSDIIWSVPKGLENHFLYSPSSCFSSINLKGIAHPEMIPACHNGEGVDVCINWNMGGWSSPVTSLNSWKKHEIHAKMFIWENIHTFPCN